MQTGQIIAALRARENMTQEQLAARLFVSRDLVSKWETGKSKPDYRMLQSIAAVFSVRVQELFDKDRTLAEELSSCIPPGCEASHPQLKPALNDFLRTLSVRDRAVFLRRYYFFETAAQIGAEYGISDAYVRTVLMRTRRKLKKHLKGAL